MDENSLGSLIMTLVFNIIASFVLLLGGVVTIVLGSYGKSNYSPALCFTIGAIFCALSIFLLFFSIWRYKKSRKNTEQITNNTTEQKN